MNSKDIKVIPDSCTVDELLPMFCCDPAVAGRFSITEPWVRKGWKYATDGSVCIRIKTKEPDTVGRDAVSRVVPAAHEKFFHIGTKWHRWPRRGCFVRRPCPSCQACIRRHPTCPVCKGKRWYLGGDMIVIARRYISTDYWWLIRHLPNVEYAPNGRRLDSLHFRFGDDAIVGEGVIMPLQT